MVKLNDSCFLVVGGFTSSGSFDQGVFLFDFKTSNEVELNCSPPIKSQIIGISFSFGICWIFIFSFCLIYVFRISLENKEKLSQEKRKKKRKPEIEEMENLLVEESCVEMEEKENVCHFDMLPDEQVLQVMRMLNAQEIAILARTCRRMRNLSTEVREYRGSI